MIIIKIIKRHFDLKRKHTKKWFMLFHSHTWQQEAKNGMPNLLNLKFIYHFMQWQRVVYTNQTQTWATRTSRSIADKKDYSLQVSTKRQKEAIRILTNNFCYHSYYLKYGLKNDRKNMISNQTSWSLTEIATTHKYRLKYKLAKR